MRSKGSKQILGHTPRNRQAPDGMSIGGRGNQTTQVNGVQLKHWRTPGQGGRGRGISQPQTNATQWTRWDGRDSQPWGRSFWSTRPDKNSMGAPWQERGGRNLGKGAPPPRRNNFWTTGTWNQPQPGYACMNADNRGYNNFRSWSSKQQAWDRPQPWGRKHKSHDVRPKTTRRWVMVMPEDTGTNEGIGEMAP